MRNAHLRLGLLEYQRAMEKISTRIRVRVDRYIGEDRKAHLLSAFGNDSDIGAVTAATHEKATFTLSFPDGRANKFSLERTLLATRDRLVLPTANILCATWLQPRKSYMRLEASVGQS